MVIAVDVLGVGVGVCVGVVVVVAVVVAVAAAVVAAVVVVGPAGHVASEWPGGTSEPVLQPEESSAVGQADPAGADRPAGDC